MWSGGMREDGTLWDCWAFDTARFEADIKEAEKKIEEFRQSLMLAKRGNKIKRLAAKAEKRSEEEARAAKDEYGRWVAGVGPKPDGVED